MDKTYAYPGGEHRFKDGKYVGFFDSQGVESKCWGDPFESWQDWDQGKEDFLIRVGFVLKDNVTCYKQNEDQPETCPGNCKTHGNFNSKIV